MTIDIEKIAADRYRLRFRGQVMTVDAAALHQAADWCLLHFRELESEAKAALREEAACLGWDVQGFPEAHREAPETVNLAPARARPGDDRQLQYQAFGDAVHAALEEPRWRTCTCETCQFVRSVLKDGE